MKPILYILLLVLAFMAIGSNQGWHRDWFESAVVATVLAEAKALPENQAPNLIRTLAALPPKQRAMVEKSCSPLFQDYLQLSGSSAQLPPNRQPGCQALFRARWDPDWDLNSDTGL